VIRILVAVPQEYVNTYCLCMFCVGPLCGPSLPWWVLCGVLPSVWIPCE